MANENIERTIYKLEVDGSAYTEGVDKVVASTNNLSASQLKANQRLAELKLQLQSNKKILEETNAVIRANEKEVIDLTKELNALKEAGKGNTAEAIKLKAALRDLAVNTKEFKVEASELKTSIANTTSQLKTQTKEVQIAEKANSGFTGSMAKVHGGLSRIGQLIPGIGIGGLVAMISGPLINAFQEWMAETDKLTAKQKLFNDIFKEAGKSAGDDIARLDVFKDKLNDLSIPLNERIKVAKEYNKIADETNKIDLKQINNLELINAQISKQNELIIQRALSTAALSKLTDAASSLVEKELKLREELRTANITEEQALKGLNAQNDRTAKINDNITKSLDGMGNRASKVLKPLIEEQKKDQIFITESLRQAILNRNASKSQLEDQTNLLSPLITPAGLTTKDPKPKAAPKTTEIENVYEQKLLELKSRLAQITSDVFKDEGLIRKEFEALLDKEFGVIDRLLKDKKLTKPQAIELKEFTVKINTALLEKDLNAFAVKRKEVADRINSELQSLAFDAETQRLNNLSDEFERERLVIENGYKKTVETIQKKGKELFAKIDEDLKKGFISDDEAVVAGLIMKKFIGDLTTQAGIDRTNRQLDLAMKIFQETIKANQRILANDLLIVSEETTQQIQLVTEQYLSGKINYEKYQKELTRIAKEESAARKKLQLQELKDELDKINKLLVVTKDPKQNKQLEDQQRAVRTNISNLERDIASGDGSDKNKTDEDARRKLGAINEYAQAIGNLVNSIVSFWQKANEAESEALDRSITLQEKRVDAAQRIAARGNAQYLKQEEDRLRELTIKRENAARRELGINAALQASQLLVGITGAITKIATPGVGVAEVIASIAVIFGALATGYGMVKSLQGNQPKLAEGTTYVKRNGQPAGKDTIPAWLDEGEAVTSARKNKDYHPVIRAIHDGSIPPEELNTFVNNYGQIIQVPKTNNPNPGEPPNVSVTNYNQVKGVPKNNDSAPIAHPNTVVENYYQVKEVPKTKVSIKPDQLNVFVKNYHPVKEVPKPNYERIKEVADLHVSYDGRMAVILTEQNRKLDENNDLQRQTLRAMKHMSVSANIDRNGVAIMVNEYMDQMAKDKKI